MKELKRYINETLGINIEVKDINPNKSNKLPFFIINSYKFKKTRLYGRDVILMFVGNEFTVDKVSKHLALTKDAFETIVIAILNPIEAYMRGRLVEKKVPFIIPGKQMYMPDLLIDFKEFAIKSEMPTHMQPAAQCLLLYHMQVESLEGINFKTISEKLHYGQMTITRAAHFLHNAGICKLEGNKDKYLHFEKNNRELWDATKSLMINPVKKGSYYTGWVYGENVFKTNINALSHYTDLNDKALEYFAVRPGYLKFIEGANLKKINSYEGNLFIEEWIYDPSLLAKDQFVDRLSLYLCFRDNQDERIEMALEQLIGNIW
ncbi:MAG TPA: hypothetical protein P5509_04600 [Bacteroidales bacterium]|nr:hypothetical protein [Bacteroidales bacterium]